jgi:hypothetical protein
MAHARDSRFEHVLRLAASDVVHTGDGTWRLSVVNGSAVQADARIAGRWLVMSALLDPSDLAPRDDLAWLRLNDGLQGTVRVARRPGDPVTPVVADLDTACDVDDLAERVATACGQLSAAFHVIRGPLDAPDPVSPATPRTAMADIQRACREGGWPCLVTNDSARIDLAIDAGVFAATLESSAAGDDRVIVHLADLSPFPPVSQRAAAALLLVTSGAVRLVKATIRQRAGVAAATLVSPLVAYRDEPIDRALDLALSALAAACQICAREVRALEDESLALAYLDLWKVRAPHDSPMAMEEHPCLQQP